MLSTGTSGRLSGRLSSTSSAAENLLNRASVDYVPQEGHTGAVTCIEASEGMNFLCTGGEDGTVRVWHWIEDLYSCYRLAMCLEHGARVTSVTFVGNAGPIIACTESGNLVVWSVFPSLSGGGATEVRPNQWWWSPSRFDLSSDPINDNCAWRKPDTGGTEILIACAFGSTVMLADAIRKDTEYSIKDSRMLEHEDKVLRVKPIPRHQNIYDGGGLVSCVDRYIFIWSLRGEKLHTLSSPNEKFPIKCCTVSPRNDDRGHFLWIIAGAGDDPAMVLLWPLRHGVLIGLDGEPEEVGEQPPPLVQYDVPQGLEDVAIDPDNEFIVLMGKDLDLDVLRIKPPKELSNEAMAQSEPGASVFQRGKEKPMLHIDTQVKHHEFVVKRDSEDNEAVLAIGFADGSCELWDLEGDDAGEMYADVRSLTHIEKLSPLILQLISFFQVISFAFGPSTTWREEIRRPVHITKHVVLFEATNLFDIPSEVTFWPESIAAVSAMVLFTVIGLAGVPERLKRTLNLAMHSRHYRKEEAEHDDQGWTHIGVSILRFIGNLVELFMWAFSTIFVVCIYKICVKCFDCILADDGDVTRLLAWNPAVTCYAEDHLVLACIIIGAMPLYFFVLVPYAVVNGDVDYVQRKTLFKPSAWRDNAVRRATLLDRGIFHPIQHNVFKTRLVELVVKIVLPCISDSFILRPWPVCLTGSIAVIGAIMLIVSLAYPPLIDRTWCAVIQGSKLLCFCTMLCGLISVIAPSDMKEEASLLLVPSVFLACIFVIWKIRNSTPRTSGTSDTPYTALADTSMCGEASELDEQVIVSARNIQREATEESEGVVVPARNLVAVPGAEEHREASSMVTDQALVAATAMANKRTIDLDSDAGQSSAAPVHRIAGASFGS